MDERRRLLLKLGDHAEKLADAAQHHAAAAEMLAGTAKSRLDMLRIGQLMGESVAYRAACRRLMQFVNEELK